MIKSEPNCRFWMNGCCLSSQTLVRRQNKRRHSITHKTVQSLDDHICSVGINDKLIDNCAADDDNKDELMQTAVQRNAVDSSQHDTSIDISNLDNNDANNKYIENQTIEPANVSSMNWQHVASLDVDQIAHTHNHKTEDTPNFEEPIISEVVHKPEIAVSDKLELANNEDIEIADSDDFPVPEGCELLIDADEDPELAAKIDAELQSNFVSDPEERVIATPYIPPIAAGFEYTLVLDLDETLIHYKDDEEYYLMRPGVSRFLEELSACYDIVLFTASVK